MSGETESYKDEEEGDWRKELRIKELYKYIDEIYYIVPEEENGEKCWAIYTLFNNTRFACFYNEKKAQEYVTKTNEKHLQPSYRSGIHGWREMLLKVGDKLTWERKDSIGCDHRGSPCYSLATGTVIIKDEEDLKTWIKGDVRIDRILVSNGKQLIY